MKKNDFLQKISEWQSPRTLRRKRILAVCGIVITLALAVLLTVFVTKALFDKVKTPEQFREYIESFGWTGRFVFLGIQFLQVFVAFIPGEIVEIGAGYAFGPWEGTALCMVGVALASILVIILTKRWGVKIVELFISPDAYSKLRFLNTEKKLRLTVFLLYFIPGTPKDLITYFIGLTPMKISEFLILTLIARIPSIASSTVGGHILAEKNYFAAVILFVITGIVSLAGLKIYSWILKKKASKNEPPAE